MNSRQPGSVRSSFSPRLWLVLLAIAALGAVFFYTSRDKPVDFASEVKPILNKHCIACHGGVRQKGGFSVLFREDALGPTKSGKPAIVPGDPGHSEFIRRLTSNDPEERMPYKHDPLSSADIDILRRWVKEGAPWSEHWAYEPLKPVPVPGSASLAGIFGSEKTWGSTDIDRFIQAKWKEQELKPSPEADKATLLRRVALDITGIPAPDSLGKKYLEDPSPEAYGRLVDSLLASPAYGEKWAAMWMDLARYADSKGYERDAGREIWRYRDWVIRAFNRDMPYDSFLTEQIAGDLLLGATDDNIIATAFHRNTMTNDEGGTDNEEFRTAAVLDRVNTTWEALMGTTFSCVQCHSHPYDPFRHDEFYRFMAFFNNTRDEDTYEDYPLLRTFDDTVNRKLDSVVGFVCANGGEARAAEVRKFLKTWEPGYHSLTTDSFLNAELADTKWLVFRNHARCRLKHVDLNGCDRLIFRYYKFSRGGHWEIHQDSVAGKRLAAIEMPDTTRDWTFREVPIELSSGVHDLYFTYVNPKLKSPDFSDAQFDFFYFTPAFPGKGSPGYDRAVRTFWEVVNARAGTTPVMMDNPPSRKRQSYVFERGNWLVKGKPVEPDVPASLPPLPAGAPRNRLGLAEWLVSENNPLTARTFVNRVWEQLFGTGLAETLEDLGSQGIPPTHPELLNFLSYRFMHADRWQVKKLIRAIVLSDAYRQRSDVSPELLKKDPYNKWYARGARVRLSAEEVRDQALAVSGLLSRKMYGPSVYPYQPKGIWLSPYNGDEWVQSKGEDQYRRALYTFWKRSASYPSMMNFDGVSREVCTSRRIRTNTPLQALTTLNDSAYIDIARHFAVRIRREAGNEPTAEIRRGFSLATGHEIDERSLAALRDLYDQAMLRFREDPKRAEGLLNDPAGQADEAALAVVANAILNLDEVITKS